MATAFVQSKRNASGFSGASGSVTFTSSISTANVVCGHTSWAAGATGDLTSVTVDGVGATIVRRISFSGRIMATFYLQNVNAGTGVVTANFSPNITLGTIYAHEVSGADTTAPLDNETGQGQSSVGTGANAVTSGAVVTSNNGCYIYGGSLPTTAAMTYTAGTGFVIREQESVSENSVSEDEIQTSAGSIAATFTSDTASVDFITMVMMFKPIAAVGDAIGAANITSSAGRYIGWTA